MKMRNLIKSVAFVMLLIFSVMLTSCSDNNGDISLANVKVAMKATTTLSSINPGARAMASDLVYTDALVGVTKIEFESLDESQMENSGDKDDDHGDDDSGEDHGDDEGDDDHGDDDHGDNDHGDDNHDEIEFKGKFVVDLLSGTSDPDFGVADVIPGVYEEIEIDLNPVMDGGLTMFIAFYYTPSGETDSVRYEYSNNYKLEFELKDKNGIEINNDFLNQILVIVDLDALFAGVDLDAATADSDGIVRINDSSNPDLAKQIARNLKSVMEVGEDDDHDGKFDDD